MWGRYRQPAEDRTPLIQQDALPEGDASVQGRPTLPLSRLGRRLLSWMRDVIENAMIYLNVFNRHLSEQLNVFCRHLSFEI